MSTTTKDDMTLLSSSHNKRRRNEKEGDEKTATTVTTNNNTNDTGTSRDYYFDSYAHHGIHEEMLKDTVRTETYKNAILNNKHLFRDKIVLDVGCGTGILSMFAAQAGAKHVYAIDCSDIVTKAKEIISLNGYDDSITVMKGKVEDTTELPNLKTFSTDNKVDIIISEWMGYFLLYESMLDTVLHARDKWLVPQNGIIFPDKATMYLCGVEDGMVKRDRIDFWSNVYGFDMSPIRDVALHEPIVDVIDSKQIITDTVPIFSVDLLTCSRASSKEYNNVNSFQSNFQLVTTRDDFLHGLISYFECEFTQVHAQTLRLSTSPFCHYTHWKQTVFYLQDVLTICENDDIVGVIDCKPNPNNDRDLDIQIQLVINGKFINNYQTQMMYRLR